MFNLWILNCLLQILDGGSAWTGGTLPETGTWSAAAYGNGRFVIIGGGRVLVSTDNGNTWTGYNLPVNTTWSDVVWTGQNFVATIGTPGGDPAGQVYYSPDGISWTAAGNNWNINELAHNESGFVVCPRFNNNQYHYSVNHGVNWTVANLANPSPQGYGFWTTCAFGNNTWVVGQRSGVGTERYDSASVDGLSWTLVDNGASFVGYQWVASSYGDNKFLWIPGGGTAYRTASTAAGTRTLQSFPVGLLWQDVIYTPNYGFCVVASNTNRFLRSATGTTGSWVTEFLTEISTWSAIANAPNRIIVVASGTNKINYKNI